MQSLRQHPVLGHEIFAGKRDQLGVARMIHGFHPDHFIGDALVVGMDMLDQLELGLAWADDQDFRGAGEGFHDLVIIVLVFRLATPADGAPLAM